MCRGGPCDGLPENSERDRRTVTLTTAVYRACLNDTRTFNVVYTFSIHGRFGTRRYNNIYSVGRRVWKTSKRNSDKNTPLSVERRRVFTGMDRETDKSRRTRRSNYR